MRRMFVSLSAISLIVVAQGCSHTAGVCDCDQTPTISCCGTTGHIITTAPPPVAKTPEAIKEMPKGPNK